MDPAIGFCAFGPLRVDRGLERLATGGRIERRVLAVLLIEPGHTVGMDRIADVFWEHGRRPRDPSHALHTHVSRLRHHLGSQLVATDHHGYRLDCDRDAIDVHRFDDAVDRGEEQLWSGDAEAAQGHYCTALDESRGRVAWIDLTDSTTGRIEQARLRERQLATEERHAALSFLLGRLPAGHLERLVAEQPLREARWMLLIRSHVAAGRQADALRSYSSARHVLRDQLGIDPSTPLANLERRVLDQDPSLMDRGDGTELMDLVQRI